MSRVTKLFILAMSVLLLAAGALATTTKTASFAVTANITPACTIGAAPLAFGAYDPLGVNNSTELDATTQLSIQCINTLAATVTLDEGLYKAGTSTPDAPLRRLQCTTATTSYLSYNLYQDASHSNVWGAGSTAMSIVGDGTLHTYTVYGKIPPAQIQEDGAYSDTIVASVIY